MTQDALILIDIQNDYFPGGKMELEGMETAAANAERVLGFFRSRNQPDDTYYQTGDSTVHPSLRLGAA